MFFIGQNLKYVHMKHSFFERLIIFLFTRRYLVFGDVAIYCILQNIKNLKYILWIQTSWEPIMKSKETFSLVSDKAMMLEKSVFNVK